MQEKTLLLDNLQKIHTTELGAARIRRNLAKLVTLGPENTDVVEFCKIKISAENACLYRHGKNWYCEADGIRLTINAGSYTIITAHSL